MESKKEPVVESNSVEKEPHKSYHRKPYQSPKLIVHGKIEEITKGGFGTASDGTRGSGV